MGLINRVCKSPVFWVNCLSIGAAIATPLLIHSPYAFATLLIPLLANTLCVKNSRHYKFEAGLIWTTLKNQAWYTKVDPRLYISAQPLKNRNHHTQFKDLGIDTVISVLEPHELTTPTLISDPVAPKDWEDLGIKHKVYPSRDFHPLSAQTIQDALVFIENETRANRTVLIHCKAGRGRSGALAVAHLANQAGEDPSLTTKRVQALRPQVSVRRNLPLIKSILKL